MSTLPKMLFALAAVSAVAVGAYLFLDPMGSQGSATSVGFELEDVESVDDSTAELEALNQTFEEASTRVEGDSAVAKPDAFAEEAEGPTSTITLTGRVVLANGTPLAGAEVSLFLQRNLESFFRGGGGQRMRGGFRNNRDLFESFRLKRVQKAVQTGNDGRFRFEGPAYAATTLEVGVQHKSFAPTTSRHEWTVKTGELDVGDIRVETGSIAYGRVIANNGNPLEGTTVRWQPRAQRGQGRGGPGGGRGGPLDRFGGSSPLEQLISEAKVDARGLFEIGPLPRGDFRLTAEAPQHLPNESGDLVSGDAPRVDAGTLTLTLGAVLSGIVLDERGGPVEGARVRASVSFEAMRAAREAAGTAQRNPGNPGNPANGGAPVANTERQRRGGDFENIARNMRITREAKTNAKGEFALDALPTESLRLSVEHPRFIDESRDPIDPKTEPRLQLRLSERLSVAGIVLDAKTGQPIENFGIASRPGGGNGRFDPAVVGDLRATLGGRRGGRNDAGSNQTLDPEQAAREAERQAAQRQQEQYRIAAFGPSGEAPQRRPKPTAHAGGKFTEDELQPGSYFLDVAAPGYAAIADGPIVVEKGKQVAPRTIRLERAAVLRGVVASSSTKKSVAGASIEIFVPPAPVAANGGAGRDANGRDNPMRRMFMGRGNDGTRVARTRSDKDGRFEVEDLRAGTYRLVVRADDHVEAQIDGVVVMAGRETERSITLGVGATLFGAVAGAKPGAALRLRHADNADNRRVNIEKDGSYEAKGLAAGGWFVTIDSGGGQDFGRMGASMFRQFGLGSQADVVLSEGVKQRYDLDANKAETGKVAGTIRVGGMPSEGYEVSLRAKTTASAAPSGGGDFNPADMIGRMASRFLRATSNGEGRFEIDNVPPGSWTVQVSRNEGGGGRRGGFGGGGGQGSLAANDINVVAGQTAQQDFDLRLGGIELDLRDGKGRPVTTARVSLVLEAEGRGVEPSEWRNLPSFRRLRVDRGIAKVEALNQGRWIADIDGNGITPVQKPLYVGVGQAPVEVIELNVDEEALQKAMAEQEARRKEREARRAEQPNVPANRQPGGGRNGGGNARPGGGARGGARNGGNTGQGGGNRNAGNGRRGND